MAIKIDRIDAGSDAEALGLQPGDELLSVDENELNDTLDYDFYTDSSSFHLKAKVADGIREWDVRRAERGPFGCDFSTYLGDQKHSCSNHCMFCFIDQLPPGMRESLYFKDDDERLSFLFGNYITMTNMQDHEIERIINKKFEKGEIPSGSAICEKQLFNLVDQIEKVKVNEEEIASLMPQIYRKLEWLDKEDIIKRVVSLEFNRMIDYYKDADEIQQVDERSARSERGERGERRAYVAEEGYSRFFLNFGKADGLYPNQLIELVNKCVPGKVRIGKIDLRENFSFFEVEEGEAQRVMNSMNGFEVDGRRISVEPAQGKKEEGGRGGKRSYGGRRSDDGYKGKRGSKDSGRRSNDRSDRAFRKDERDSDRPWKRTAAARDARKKRRF